MDSIVDIQRQVQADTDDWFPERDDLGVPYLVIALAGEVGEFANMVKKDIRDQAVYTKEHHLELCMELVDILVYLCQLANALNLNLAEGYALKRSINVERFARGPRTVVDRIRNDSDETNGKGEGVRDS
jgi:NTP pyrophosphatase (non-canonical NTP hydrolase)